MGVHDTNKRGWLQQAQSQLDEFLKTTIRGNMRQVYLYFGLIIYPLSKHSRASMLLVYAEGARGTPDTHLAANACTLILQVQNVFRPYIRSIVSSFNHSFFHSIAHLSLQSFLPSFKQALVHSVAHSCIHPRTHSTTRLLDFSEGKLVS